MPEVPNSWAEMIRIKRVYYPVEKKDGPRILVDRIWPRGMPKEKLQADLWLKDAAPGTELRKWFNHDPARWDEFKKRYFAELDQKPETIRRILDLAQHKPVTLLYAARDTQYNHAAALKKYLDAIL